MLWGQGPHLTWSRTWPYVLRELSTSPLQPTLAYVNQPKPIVAIKLQG
jgi:hypothetical protein